jgi:hypothetical protein
VVAGGAAPARPAPRQHRTRRCFPRGGPKKGCVMAAMAVSDLALTEEQHGHSG